MVVAGIVGGLVAVPLLAVLNTAIRYLFSHPEGEPTPDREPPGTRPTDESETEIEEAHAEASQRRDDGPPPAETSMQAPA